MSTAPVTPPAPTAAPLALPEPASFTDGVTTPADIATMFGLEPEDGAAGSTPTPTPTGDKPAEKPAEAPAEGDGGEKPAEGGEQAAADDEDPDAKALREILQRSRAKRREREAARARQVAPAAAAVPEKKPETPPATAKPEDQPRTPSAGVQAAVRDVLNQLDRLAGEDAAAAASGAQPTQAADAKRNEVVEALREKIEGISKALEKGNPELLEKVETLSAALTSMENQRVVRAGIARTIDGLEAELPTLHDTAVLRTIQAPDGRRYRDPAEMVYDAAEAFWKKYQLLPDIKLLAKRLERKLASAGSEKQTGNSPNEKKSPSRKTVSSSHASPPAARTGPDSRSRKDAESDFYSSLGIDPHS